MEDAIKLHPFYRGKIETTLKCCIRDFQDFGIWYTPGVSKPCLEIKDDPEKVYEHTNKWNTVAVISDGTRVLGMGDIGPKAGMPVMEGKSPPLQVPRRRRRLPAHGRHQGPGQVHRVRQARAAGPRRREPRGHLAAQVLPHPRHAARGVRDPGVARRPAGHGVRHARRPGQRAQGRRQEDRRGQDRLHRLGRRQRRHQPADLRLRRHAGPLPRRRQQGHPSQGPRRHRGRQGRVGRQVEVLPDHQRGAASGRHRRGAQGRRRLHRAQQAGPGHDREGLGQGDGARLDRLHLRQPGARDVALGRARRRAPRWSPPAVPTSRTRSTTRSASPASSAARSTCAPRRSPTRCASPPRSSSPRWPRTRA